MRILNWLGPSTLFSASVPVKDAQVRAGRHSCYLTKNARENGERLTALLLPYKVNRRLEGRG